MMVPDFLPYTPFTLQAVSPVVSRIWLNLPILESSYDVHMPPCETVSNCPLSCSSYRSFEIFEVSASDFDTVSMCRRFRACMYEFLTIVTESVVHDVHKVVIWLSFGIIWQHKLSLGIGCFAGGELRLMEVASW